MTYCTQSDLVNRYGEAELVQLTNPDAAGATTIDATVLADAITDAGAEIDGYLAAYVPLDPVPPNLKRLCCDIVRYHLYSTVVPELISQRYDQAIRYLEQVAAGKIALAPDATGATPDAGADIGVVAADTVFSASNLADF